MATIADIANKVSCGVNVLGTGTINSCEPILLAASSLWFTKRGFVFDKTKTLDEAYVQTLQQERKLIILKDVIELTVNKEENPKETDELGVMAVLRDGLYSFTAKFKKGFEYAKALSSLKSFRSFDVSIVDNQNNILATSDFNGSFKGFSLGMLDFDGITLSNNSNIMTQGLSFQFLYNDEIEDNSFFISNKELGTYKPKKQDGVNQTIINITTPANLATTIVASVKLSNGRESLTGLALTDFLVTVDGASVTPSNLAETNGVYTFTVSALATGEVVTISLFDTGNKTAIVFGGEVYQSNTATSVVTGA